jgi:hypothetical protein
MRRRSAAVILMLALCGPAIAQDATPLRLTLDPAPVGTVQPLAHAPLPVAADPIPRWIRLTVEKTIDNYQRACGNQRNEATIAITAASPAAPRIWTCGAR